MKVVITSCSPLSIYSMLCALISWNLHLGKWSPLGARPHPTTTRKHLESGCETGGRRERGERSPCVCRIGLHTRVLLNPACIRLTGLPTRAHSKYCHSSACTHLHASHLPCTLPMCLYLLPRTIPKVRHEHGKVVAVCSSPTPLYGALPPYLHSRVPTRSRAIARIRLPSSHLAPYRGTGSLGPYTM